MPEDIRYIYDWQRTWQALGAATCDETLCRAVLGCYDEPHRKYHTRQHLTECLDLCREVERFAQHPAEVALALWFHDAMYDARRHDNEEMSADWARETVVGAGLATELADRIGSLILATRHDVPSGDGDARLVVDIDLAILGASAERFDEYEAQIRAEYAWVPDEAFRHTRAALLERFLARTRIYASAALAGRLETQARQNLQRSVLRLVGSSGRP